jgi:hypothetical protein
MRTDFISTRCRYRLLWYNIHIEKELQTQGEVMNLSEVFQHYGIGVLATADRDGQVNTAVYARPHLIDADTLVWGMTEGRSYRNIVRNPHACYLFRTSGPGFQGVRLGLELLRTEESGEMLTQIQQNTNEVVGPGAGSNVTHAAWFRVVEIRSLI